MFICHALNFIDCFQTLINQFLIILDASISLVFKYFFIFNGIFFIWIMFITLIVNDVFFDDVWSCRYVQLMLIDKMDESKTYQMNYCLLLVDLKGLIWKTFFCSVYQLLVFFKLIRMTNCKVQVLSSGWMKSHFM